MAHKGIGIADSWAVGRSLGRVAVNENFPPQDKTLVLLGCKYNIPNTSHIIGNPYLLIFYLKVFYNNLQNFIGYDNIKLLVACLRNNGII